MKIQLNNNPEEFVGLEKVTVTELLRLKNFTLKLLVVKINNKPIGRDQYDTSVIHDGDDVLVIHLISGG